MKLQFYTMAKTGIYALPVVNVSHNSLLVCFNKERAILLGCGVNVLAQRHWFIAEEARLSSMFTSSIAWV